MEYPSRIPSQLRPFEIKGLTVSEYPVTEDNGEYYIEVDIESRGSMFVTFYDENGNKLDDVNYKLSEDKITIYIGEPAYNRLDLVIFSNGEHFDQLDIWAQNPENHMELFSLDLYDIPKKTDPDYETKMAVLNEYRLAVGRKSAPTYNMTIQEILRYFEQEGIFPLFLRVDGYLRNVAGFDNSSARSNLEILSKEEIWGRWDSDNEYSNPTGLMYNQNLFNGGGDGTDGRLPNSDSELLRDNNASLHLYGLNQNMPNAARRIEMNNVVAVKGEWNKYVWPYLDYSEYKIKKITPSASTSSITPVFKDGYYREGGLATPFLEKDISDPYYGNIAMFNRAYTNNILFQKKYWNNTDNTGDHHTMDNRSNWYMSVVVNLHFAVPKNFPVPAVLNFDTTGQVKQYLDSLLSSTSLKYDIGNIYTVLTGQRFRTHYKGKCYDGPENAYKKNEDSNSLTFYGYDSYNNPVSGTREPQSLFDFESTVPFYPHGNYKGDLYPGPNSDSDKYASDFIVGNINSGWNAKNPDEVMPILPDSNSNIWHNRSVAYLAYNRNVGKYCIMLFMEPAINKENNINDWGNNEWWIEGDSMLM